MGMFHRLKINEILTWPMKRQIHVYVDFASIFSDNVYEDLECYHWALTNYAFNFAYYAIPLFSWALPIILNMMAHYSQQYSNVTKNFFCIITDKENS